MNVKWIIEDSNETTVFISVPDKLDPKTLGDLCIFMNASADNMCVELLPQGVLEEFADSSEKLHLSS